MKFQIITADKLFTLLAAITLSANFAMPSISLAEDDPMGSMPNQQQNSMQKDAPDSSDSTDVDHDHDQMKKDHAQMKKDHKMMMKHGSADQGKGSPKKTNKPKKKMNSSDPSNPGMMDDDKMDPGNSGGMDHM